MQALASATVSPCILRTSQLAATPLEYGAETRGGQRLIFEAPLAWTRGFAAQAQEAHEDASPKKARMEYLRKRAAEEESNHQDGTSGEGEEAVRQAVRPGGDESFGVPPKHIDDKGGYWLMQPVYKREYVESVKPKHLEPKTIRQKLALAAITTVRWTFDKVTGYGPEMNEQKWLRRIVFLETVAGVPGMVGGMLRHMKSLRTMKRDNAWIHTLLEEAENERMHLLTFMQLRQPGPIFRGMVLAAQGVFFNFMFIAYLISPRWVHSMVGYLEEEAVHTYTRCIKELDEGKIPEWTDKLAPEIAVKYWALGEGAKMRDLLLAVRADEAGHSHVNHVLSQLKPDEPNPFAPGSHEVP